jgi:hypothetical protein
MALTVSPAWADSYQDTINVFRKAVQSSSFFRTAYGYAVFPTIGKGRVGIGGAFGNGRVYERGKYVGDTSMTQLTVGTRDFGTSKHTAAIFPRSSQARHRIIADFSVGKPLAHRRTKAPDDMNSPRYDRLSIRCTAMAGNRCFCPSI